jgi:hypothetical protein
VIRVEQVEEPEKFDRECRQPGKKWLGAHPGGDPHKNPLWSAFHGELRDAFHGRCGFLGLWIHRGTVDHWVSVNNQPSLAYEWSNYRYVAGELNSAKKPAWDGKLLDPFEIDGEWFEIQLPSLQLVLIADVPADVRERVEFTLDKLHLRDGEEVVRIRREWVKQYELGGLSLERLHHFAPLIARAIAKRDGLALQALVVVG